MSQGNATLKCYMGDTGLLVAQAFADRATTPSEVYRDILLDKLAINEGTLVENAVAQQLRASGHALFFFSRSSANKERRMEIDLQARNTVESVVVVTDHDDARAEDKVFSTMRELIGSVDWASFEATNRQFSLLTEI